MRAYFLMILVAALSSCAKEKLVPADYIAWVDNESNGLTKSRTFGDLMVTARFRPVEYQVAIGEGDPELKSDVLSSRREQLEGMQYYMVRFSLLSKSKDVMKHGISSEQEYYERLNYCSFGLQEDIMMVQDGDTLRCRLFNAVRSYGLSPNADYILAFEEKTNEGSSDRTLIIDDKVYGLGKIKFAFSQDDLEDIPAIRTY